MNKIKKRSVHYISKLRKKHKKPLFVYLLPLRIDKNVCRKR